MNCPQCKKPAMFADNVGIVIVENVYWHIPCRKDFEQKQEKEEREREENEVFQQYVKEVNTGE